MIQLLTYLMNMALSFIAVVWILAMIAFCLHHVPQLQMYIWSRICTLFKRPSECHVVRVDGHYEVVYSIGESIYRLYVEQGVTLSPILTVQTEDGIDVTKTVKQYLGPRRDFGGVVMTPRMMGLGTLVITYNDFEERMFDVDDVIHLTNN
jgi:hypothetical protein